MAKTCFVWRCCQDNCTKSFLKNPTREVPEIPYSWEWDRVAELQPKNLMLVIMMSKVCVRHRLEGVQVELYHLAGCQATGEPVQRHHVHSSQLLCCQGVMFGHGLPDRPHLHSWDTLISDQREYQQNIDERVTLFVFHHLWFTPAAVANFLQIIR